MTEGSIPKKLILFALPVFAGQLLQQLYNVRSEERRVGKCSRKRSARRRQYDRKSHFPYGRVHKRIVYGHGRNDRKKIRGEKL